MSRTTLGQAQRHKKVSVTPLPRRTPEMNRKAAKITRILVSIAASETTIPKKWRFSRGRWRRHRCKLEPLQQRHRSLRPCFIERAKKRLAGVDEKTRQAAEALHQAESEKAADIQQWPEVERLRAQLVQLQAQVQDPPTAKRRVAHFPACPTRSFLARCLHGWKSGTI